MADRYAAKNLYPPDYDGMPKTTVSYSSPFIGASDYASKTVSNGNYASKLYTDEAMPGGGGGATFARLTESGDRRITEAGDARRTE